MGILLRLSVVLLLAGCASTPFHRSPETAEAPLPPAPEAPGAADRMEEAVRSLGSGDYEAGHALILEVTSTCPATSEFGSLARLLSASADLDPRNPEGRPDRAAASIASVLHEGPPSAWSSQFAETLYLLALNMGGAVPETPTPALASSTPIDSTAEASGGADSEASASSRLRTSTRYLRDREEEKPDPCGATGESLSGADPLPELPLAPLTLRIRMLEQEKVRMAEKSEELSAEIARLEEELRRIRRTLIPSGW